MLPVRAYITTEPEGELMQRLTAHMEAGGFIRRGEAPEVEFAMRGKAWNFTFPKVKLRTRMLGGKTIVILTVVQPVWLPLALRKRELQSEMMAESLVQALQQGTTKVTETTEDIRSTLEEQARAERAMAAGVNWFYVVIAFSILNAVLVNFGENISFLFALGINQYLDVVMRSAAHAVAGWTGTAILVFNLLLDTGIALAFAGLAMLARRKKPGAYELGVGLYALDMVFFFFTGNIYSILFHIIVLMGLVGGLRASRQLQKLEKYLFSIPPTSSIERY